MAEEKKTEPIDFTAVQSIHSVDQWNKLLADHTYVLVDFTATWCGPCKVIAPMFTQWAKDLGVEKQLAFAKIDVDEDATRKIVQEYGVSAMPTFIPLKDGQPFTAPAIQTVRGANPPALNILTSELNKLAKVAYAEAANKAAATANAEVPAAAPAAAEAKVEEADPAKDTPTVSGGYTMGGEGEKRADWKTSTAA